MSRTEKTSAKRFWWIFVRAALLIGFLVGVGVWFYARGLDVNALLQRAPKEQALSIGLWVFGLFTFVTVAPIIVRDVLRIYAALSLGLFLSAFWIWLAETAAAVVSFYIARYLGRDFVELLAGKRVEGLNRYLERAGFKTIVVLRLIPLTPYRPLNFAAGLTRIDFKAYLLGTLLGALPHVFLFQLVYSSLGEVFRRSGGGTVVWVNIAVSIITGAFIALFSLFARKKSKADALSSKG